jgi:hypothetical protein
MEDNRISLTSSQIINETDRSNKMSKHLKLSIVCFALAFLCLVGLAYSAFATNYYVNTASSGGDGTTTATSGAQAAFATVAAAQAALTGDQHGNFLLFNKGNT